MKQFTVCGKQVLCDRENFAQANSPEDAELIKTALKWWLSEPEPAYVQQFGRALRCSVIHVDKQTLLAGLTNSKYIVPVKPRCRIMVQGDEKYCSVHNTRWAKNEQAPTPCNE